MQISYFDEIPQLYAKALSDARDLESLLHAVSLYSEVAKDAYEAVARMSADNFIDWQAALKKERRGTFMGEEAYEKFGCILMPDVMFRISALAAQHTVPWGLAYNRLKDAGRLQIRDGFAVLKT